MPGLINEIEAIKDRLMRRHSKKCYASFKLWVEKAATKDIGKLHQLTKGKDVATRAGVMYNPANGTVETDINVSQYAEVGLC